MVYQDTLDLKGKIEWAIELRPKDSIKMVIKEKFGKALIVYYADIGGYGFSFNTVLSDYTLQEGTEILIDLNNYTEDEIDHTVDMITLESL